MTSKRTEKALKKWLATDIIDRDVNSFKDGRVELSIWVNDLGTWCTIAKFTIRSIVQKRYPRKKKTTKRSK
jgi:hypothetical protein